MSGKKIGENGNDIFCFRGTGIILNFPNFRGIEYQPKKYILQQQQLDCFSRKIAALSVSYRGRNLTHIYAQT